MRRLDEEAVRAEPLAQVVAHLRLPGEFLEQRLVGADQLQLVLVLEQLDAAIAADGLAEVGAEVRRQRKLAVTGQDVDHRRRGQAGGGRVPQRQIGEPIGVDVLGAFFQLGERSEGVARLGIARIVHLDQDRAVTLHDEGIGGIVVHSLPRNGEPMFTARLRRKWQCSGLWKSVQGEKDGPAATARPASGRRAGWFADWSAQINRR